MKLKKLTPRHLREFDDKYQSLEEAEGKWNNFERAFLAAVWAGWFVESPNWPGPKSEKAEVIAYIDDMDLGHYTDLCTEINKIYLTGRQSDTPPAKDPN